MTGTVLWSLVVLVLVGGPLLGAWRVRRRRALLATGDPAVRRRATVRSIGIQWTMTLALAAAWIADGRGLTGLRLDRLPEGPWQIGATIGVLVLFQTLATGWFRASRSPAALHQLRKTVEPSVLGLMPRTSPEWVRFGALAVTAGVCEEFIYRGVAFALVTETFGVIAAVVVTSVAFGAGHAYQGVSGMFRTGLLGAVFAGIVLTTGALWLAMALHALADLFQGYLLATAVAAPEE